MSDDAPAVCRCRAQKHNPNVAEATGRSLRPTLGVSPAAEALRRAALGACTAGLAVEGVRCTGWLARVRKAARLVTS